MTSKKRLSEQARLIIQGGSSTADTEISLAEVSIYVEQCFASLIKMNLFANKQEGEATINGDFVYSFDNVEILNDDTKGLYYCLIPGSTIALPYDLGVHQVSLQKDQSDVFVRVPNGFSGLYSGLESFSMESRNVYYLESDRLIFPSLEPEDRVGGVLLKMIAPLSAIDNDTEINIPLDMQHEIVRKAAEMYVAQQMGPKDTENDNIK